MIGNKSIQSVAILANPKAGTGKAMKTAQWLSNQLTINHIANTIYCNQWPTSEVLNTFSDCWIIGGDGTINYFINHYPNCALVLALFDGGTGNDFAWKLYNNTNLSERYHQVMKGKPSYIDAGKVNDQLYINCMGVGFDGEIIQSMKAIRFLGGHLGYLLAVLLKIISFKEKYVSITNGENKWTGKYLLVLLVNSSRAGGGFYIAPTAQVNDGALNMVLCEALPIWKRFIYLPIIKSGKHMQLPFIKHQLGNEFTVHCEQITPVQVDGELLFASHILVQILSNQFLFRY